MLQNIFRMNTIKEGKKGFSKRFLIFLFISIFLTGVVSAGGFAYLLIGSTMVFWDTVGIYEFSYNVLYYVITFISFLTLIKITAEEILFSRTLVHCVQLIGILLSIFAFVGPHLPNYTKGSFAYFQFGNFIRIDGRFLLPGILLLILGVILTEGLHMQKEMDEIL